MTLKLFDLAGYDAARAEKITDEALQYDKLLAPHVKVLKKMPTTAKCITLKAAKNLSSITNTLI